MHQLQCCVASAGHCARPQSFPIVNWLSPACPCQQQKHLPKFLGTDEANPTGHTPEAQSVIIKTLLTKIHNPMHGSDFTNSYLKLQ